MILTTKLNIAAFLLVVGLFVFLQKVFSGDLILSQSFSLGSATIHYYGLIMALAVGVGYYVAMKRIKYFNISETQAENIIFWTCISGFIGARLYHVLSSFSYYLNNPVDIFKVWNGGLSIYGAVIGGVLALYFVVKIFNPKSSIMNLLNWLTPSLILGQIIGRFGNMFNYEAFGYPTELPWKMFVPLQFRPLDYQLNNFFHPFFLYEAIGNVVILSIFLFVFYPGTRRPQKGELGKWPSVRGFVAPLSKLTENLVKLRGDLLFIYYVLLYNILRFCLEYLRIDSTYIGVLRLNSIMSLVIVVVSFLYINYARKTFKVS